MSTGSINTTIIQSLANTTSQPMPLSQPLDWWTVAHTCLRGANLPAGVTPTMIEIQLSTGGRLSIPVFAPAPAAAPVAPPSPKPSETPDLSATQKKILAALAADGAMKGDVLAEKCGFARPSSMYGKRGMRQLIEAGLVWNDAESGYDLTDEGVEAAEQVMEG